MEKSVSTKGQLWSIDFIVGSVLFILMVIAFFNQLGNTQAPESVSHDLLREAMDTSGLLLTEGLSRDWNGSDVLLLGITDGSYRISHSKWNDAAQMNYSAVRSALRLTHNTFIFAEDKDGCQVTALPPIGEGMNITQACPIALSMDVSNLVPVRRVAIYNGSATKISIYAWD